MRTYELALVFRPSLSEAQRKKLLDSIKGWLKDIKIVKEDAWGLKALSYPIKKETSGYFSVLSLEAGDAVMSADVEKKIQAQEDIIRHLLIRKKDIRTK